jgi:hypothetical protein
MNPTDDQSTFIEPNYRWLFPFFLAARTAQNGLLSVRETCRILRCKSQMVYSLLDSKGGLVGHKNQGEDASKGHWRVYAWSVLNYMITHSNLYGRADMSAKEIFLTTFLGCQFLSEQGVEIIHEESGKRLAALRKARITCDLPNTSAEAGLLQEAQQHVHEIQAQKRAHREAKAKAKTERMAANGELL